jgi:acetolactate synthase-1/2/3 large subunit
MLEQLESTDAQVDQEALDTWWKQCRKWREVHGINQKPNHQPSQGDLIKPQDVIRALYRATGGQAIVTSDVGQHQMFAAQYDLFDRPRQWLNSGGLGTMGYGLPAAMGAVFADRSATVACVTGEGSIQMCIQELSTCKQYHLPIKIINLNNQALGMVKQWQDMNYEGRYSQSLYEESLPDFIKLAEAYGHVGIKVTRFDELDEKMAECFALTDRVVFMDIYVDPMEHVYPMHVPEGSMRDMWLSKTERT